MTLKKHKYVLRGKILCPVLYAVLDVDTQAVHLIIVVNEQNRTDRVTMTSAEFDRLLELETESDESTANSSK